MYNRRNATPVRYHHNRTVNFGDLQSRKRVWVATGDGGNRFGRLSARQHKKWTCDLAKITPMRRQIFAEVVNPAVTISELLARNQCPAAATGSQQACHAIGNLQQSLNFCRRSAWISTRRYADRFARNQAQRSAYRTYAVPFRIDQNGPQIPSAILRQCSLCYLETLPPIIPLVRICTGIQHQWDALTN